MGKQIKRKIRNLNESVGSMSRSFPLRKLTKLLV